MATTKIPTPNHKSFSDGWFRTGDQGRFNQDGDIFFIGRIKELIGLAIIH